MPPKKNTAGDLGLTPKAKPQQTKSWRKSKRGKRDLLRAVKDRISKANAAFATFGNDPDHGKPKLTFEAFPSHWFLKQAERFMLARYCNYLLQSLLLLARVYQVPPLLLNTFGEGLMTSARCALFFCRTTVLNNQEAKNLVNLKRHMYCRMLQENESREAVEQLLKEEWGEDRETNFGGRVDEWLGGHLREHVSSGRYPRTNLSLDVDAQWADVWQEPRINPSINSMRKIYA